MGILYLSIFYNVNSYFFKLPINCGCGANLIAFCALLGAVSYLPKRVRVGAVSYLPKRVRVGAVSYPCTRDRKSTRLNSSH